MRFWQRAIYNIVIIWNNWKHAFFIKKNQIIPDLLMMIEKKYLAYFNGDNGDDFSETKFVSEWSFKKLVDCVTHQCVDRCTQSGLQSRGYLARTASEINVLARFLIVQFSQRIRSARELYCCWDGMGRDGMGCGMAGRRRYCFIVITSITNGISICRFDIDTNWYPSIVMYVLNENSFGV